MKKKSCNFSIRKKRCISEKKMQQEIENSVKRGMSVIVVRPNCRREVNLIFLEFIVCFIGRVITDNTNPVIGQLKVCVLPQDWEYCSQLDKVSLFAIIHRMRDDQMDQRANYSFLSSQDSVSQGALIVNGKKKCINRTSLKFQRFSVLLLQLIASCVFYVGRPYENYYETYSESQSLENKTKTK